MARLWILPLDTNQIFQLCYARDKSIHGNKFECVLIRSGKKHINQKPAFSSNAVVSVLSYLVCGTLHPVSDTGDGEDNVNHIYSPINPPQLLLAVTAWYGRYRCWEMIVSPSVLAAPQSPSVHHLPVTVILTRFCIGDCHSIILCVLWVMSIESP